MYTNSHIHHQKAFRSAHASLSEPASFNQVMIYHGLIQVEIDSWALKRFNEYDNLGCREEYEFPAGRVGVLENWQSGVTNKTKTPGSFVQRQYAAT
ncbi:DUF7693 family protein [Pseudomonas migulae]